MSATNVKTRSGNRVVVEFDGIQVGLVQTVRYSDDYGQEPASGVGDAHVQEYVPGMARHTVQVGLMVLIRKSLAEQGLIPENADDVLKGTVFDIVSYDKDNPSTIVRAARNVCYASGDLDIQAHRIVVRNATFMALDMKGKGG